jgi:putative transposase
MILNDPGKMIDEWWKRLEQKYEVILLDEYVVMPNHFHGIIMIIKDDYVKADPLVLQRKKVVRNYVGADPCVRPQRNTTLSDILQWFKTMTTNEYIENVKVKKWKPFNKKLWQRSYYDRIIRNERELYNIRAYIINNPVKWEWEKNENIGKLNNEGFM